ncbi:MAG: nicotinate-nucleotide adenylyltransferase [Acidobacteriota bacterium]
MGRLGVFGGTFDPIHIGHLAAAERTLSDFDLDRIIFVPANVPPHKPDHVVTPPEHRMNMVLVATAENPCFNVSNVEMVRGGRSFTVDTMVYFREMHPEDELFFIMGMDSLLELDTWHDVEGLVALCRLVVVARPGYELDKTDSRLVNLPPIVWDRIDYLQVPGLDISATDIRSRLKEGKSVRYLLIPQVYDYIQDHGLFGGGYGG